MSAVYEPTTGRAFPIVERLTTAQRLQLMHRAGWISWFGQKTLHYWASHRSVPYLVEALSEAELIERVEGWNSVSSAHELLNRGHARF